MLLRRAARIMATVELAVVFLNCVSCSAVFAVVLINSQLYFSTVFLAVQCLLLGLICRYVGAAWMDNGKKCQAGNLSLYNSNVRSDLIGMNYVVKS